MDCADFCWGMVKLVVVMLNSPPGGGQIRGKARFWGQPGGLGRFHRQGIGHFPLHPSFTKLSAENAGVILSRLPLLQIFSPISLHPSPLFFESKRGYFLGIPYRITTLQQKPKRLMLGLFFEVGKAFWLLRS